MSNADTIAIIEMCITDDEMTWADAVQAYRRETGAKLRDCFTLADRWKALQKSTSSDILPAMNDGASHNQNKTTSHNGPVQQAF